ncbi:MAG: hotdog domain-containing protein [Acutalibacteraceae bacterium]|nr:hotdog domain-containing protein [Acutalibacteraceae bacterium]
MEIEIGKKLKKSDIVTADKLACNVGSGSVEVYATPMVVALMESVSAELAQGFVPEGCTTVGTSISIEHLSATAEGAEVYATAELIESDGRKFEFIVEAYDNAGLIAKGTHQRFSVKTEKFLAKAKSKLGE